MAMDEKFDIKFSHLSATKIRNLIRKNKSKKIELYNFYINNVKKNKKLKVFKKFDEKKIKLQLKNHKNKNEPLYFIPVGIKDIFNTYEYPNSMGSKIYNNYFPGNDARIVSDIRSKGGIIFGKTHASEFAVHEPAPTLHYLNKKLSPGTSSGGSAVAVATKMVPIALGSQTAGSIIRPASYCGVFGFKPTFGTIARTGVLKTADTLDSIGFFSNHIDDLKTIYNSVRQKGKNYPYIKNDIPKNKINYSKKRFIIAKIIGPKTKNIDPELIQKYENVLKKLSKIKNIKIVNFKLPKLCDKAHYYHDILYSKSLSYYLKKEYISKSNKISKSLKKLLRKGFKINNSLFDEALLYQNNIISYFDKKFKNIDFFIDLSTFSTAPLRGENGIEDHNLIWTMAHIPVLSLPIFKNKENMPYGMLLCSKKYDDLKLLNFSNYVIKKIMI